MANLTSALLPVTATLLQELGERLRLARLRRRLQSKQVADRAGMSVITLRKIERGDAGVTMGAYISVLQVLQLQSDLKKIAAEDPLGRRLQDVEGEGSMRVRRTMPGSEKHPATSTATSVQQQNPSEQKSASKKGKISKPDSEQKENRVISGDDLLKLLILDGSDVANVGKQHG